MKWFNGDVFDDEKRWFYKYWVEKARLQAKKSLEFDESFHANPD